MNQLLVLLPLMLLVACDRAGSGAVETTPPLVERTEPAAFVVTPGGNEIGVELALTDEQRARGLMFRESLAPDRGMLFFFPYEDRWSFWMKNTMIPLDIIWIDRERRIAHIERQVPPCRSDPCPSYAPDAAGYYVLELAGGRAAELNLQTGDVLEFRNVPDTAGEVAE
jgi:uncharacterized protein